MACLVVPLLAAGCIAAGCIAAGCAGESVRAYTAAGQQAAVSRYKTFGVVVPDPEELKENQMRPETLRRLADLSVEQMQGLGYQPVAASDAELLLGLSPQATLYGPLRVVNDSGRTDPALDREFDGEGMLTVKFVDMRAKQVVLERVVQTRINTQPGEQQMRDIIGRVFEGLPRAAEGAAPAQ